MRFSVAVVVELLVPASAMRTRRRGTGKKQRTPGAAGTIEAFVRSTSGIM
jgi:hypothetical protein